MFEAKDYAKVIALTGQKHSGKTTAATFMAAELSEIGYTVTITGIGSPIKKEMMRNGWNGIKTVSDRQQMLDIWKDSCAVKGDMCYIDQFESLWRESITSDFIIITDCRREQDAAWLREIGAVVVHMRSGNDVITDDPTEQLLIPKIGDMLIDNSGTLEELHTFCHAIVRSVVV